MKYSTYIKSFLVISGSFILSCNSDQSRTIDLIVELKKEKSYVTSNINIENSNNKIELKIMLEQLAPRYCNNSESENWERILVESSNASFNDLFCLTKKRELSGRKALTDNTHDSYRISCNDSGAGLERGNGNQHKGRSKTGLGYNNQKPLESCESESMQCSRVIVPFNIDYKKINPRT